MKRTSLLLALAAISLVACNTKTGYKIVGTGTDLVDGDTIYMQEIEGRIVTNVDSSFVKEGFFEFKGEQAVPAYRVISSKKGRKDFFLENGTITIQLGEKSSAIGTPLNAIYSDYNHQVDSLKEIAQTYTLALQDSSVLESEKKDATEKLKGIETEYIAVLKQTISKNITNSVGVYLFKSMNYYLDYSEIGDLIAQITEPARSDKGIMRLDSMCMTAKKVAVGNSYVDLAMNTPEGKPIKLSDYVGKESYVLIDFWASWCGPCRKETPKLVELYQQYNKKGLQIVGVSLDRDLISWQNGIKQLGITWPQLSDLKFWSSEGAKLYAVRSIPYLVLIDKEGVIVSSGLSAEEVVKQLDVLLNSKK